MNKSVLFVSQSFYPSVGGVSTLLLNLSRYLHKAGYNIHAIHFEMPENQSASKKIGYKIIHHVINKSLLSDKVFQGYAKFKEVIYQHLHGLIKFQYAQIEDVPGYTEYITCSELFSNKLRSVVSKENIDLVHLQDYQVLGVLSALPYGIKSIFSLHAPLLSNIDPKVSEWLMRYIRKADAVVFSVPKYSEVANTLLDIPKSKIATIPPIIDKAVMESANSSPIKTFEQFSDKTNFVTCVQRFDSKSGQLQLIESFALICKKHPNVFLVLVGGRSFTDSISNVRKNYFQEAVDLVKKLKIDDRVIFLGNVDYLNLPQIYKQSDIVVMLSKMECFGLAITEAMYHSKPVIVTDVGGLAYQVNQGYNGFKVKPGDIKETSRLLDLLLSSSSKRRVMGHNARLFFNKLLDPDKIMPKYLDLYSSVLSKRMHEVNYDYLYNQLR